MQRGGIFLNLFIFFQSGCRLVKHVKIVVGCQKDEAVRAREQFEKAERRGKKGGTPERKEISSETFFIGPMRPRVAEGDGESIVSLL